VKMIGFGVALLCVAVTSPRADCPGAEGALEQRWLELCSRLQQQGASGDHEAIYRTLVARYCEPHRAYHTLAHVEHALRELDGVRDLAEDPVAVELALWFHDVVYDIGASNNEEESARLAREAATNLGLTATRVDRVSQLILATRHDSPPTDADSRLVVDIDLAILGQPAERFDAYEEAIRKEYAPVIEQRGAAQFDAGRARILRRFLSRPTIYSTEYFRHKYEDAARANLRRSIERLEGASSQGSRK
jgi:predicted metal-dependent HD superfamily phosphohydrolase